MTIYLDFEKPIAELEHRLHEAQKAAHRDRHPEAVKAAMQKALEVSKSDRLKKDAAETLERAEQKLKEAKAKKWSEVQLDRKKRDLATKCFRGLDKDSFLAKASANKARMEIKQTGDIIASLYNEAGRHNPKLFRFPYRSIGHEGMIRREFGLQIVGWDYDTSDYRSEGRNTGKSMGIIRGAQEHAIVLMHDYPGTATVIRQLGAYGIASQALGPGGAAQYGLNVRHPVPFC